MSEFSARKREVRASFGAKASYYMLDSARPDGHGDELPCLVALAGAADGLALDVGSGGGVTALPLARVGWPVLLLDLSAEMLRGARAHLRRAGLPAAARLDALQADADAIPLATASLALLTVRNASHHFFAPAAFLQEAARVLRPGGRLILCDLVGHERPDFDAHLQDWERRRDPTHVASLSVTRWHALLREAGLTPRETLPHRYRHHFARWTARQGMSDRDRDALARAMLAAPAVVRDYFEVLGADGVVEGFATDVALIISVR